MKRSLLSLIGLSAVLPAAAFAAPGIQVDSFGALVGIFCSILDKVFVVFIFAVIVFVIVAAFHYLTSQGNPEKVTKANKTITYAAIAVAVALFAAAFPRLIASIMNDSSVQSSCSSGSSSSAGGDGSGGALPPAVGSPDVSGPTWSDVPPGYE